MLPKMNYADRMKRANDKKMSLLYFLAGFEVYTSVENAAKVMRVSTRRSVDTINKLENQGFLNHEMHFVQGRTMKIIGITPHGLAMADASGDVHPDAPFFELGRINSSNLRHKLDGQILRLIAESRGCEWMNEREIQIAAKRSGKWKKIPDAWCFSPGGRQIAIEVERFAKTPKRYREIVMTYLNEMSFIDEVHYVSPKGIQRLIQSAFSKCRALPDGWESKFKFHEFDKWDPVDGDPY